MKANYTTLHFEPGLKSHLPSRVLCTFTQILESALSTLMLTNSENVTFDKGAVGGFFDAEAECE